MENAISGGGFTTVSLRPGAFARNAIRFWARQIRHNRMVGLPFPDSQQAPIADEDIAAVAVRAITTPDLDGTKPVLTGPDSLTMRDQVRLIGEAIGEPIGISVLSEREARALYGEVLPPEYLDLLMAQWEFETPSKQSSRTRSTRSPAGMRSPIANGRWPTVTHLCRRTAAQERSPGGTPPATHAMLLTMAMTRPPTVRIPTNTAVAIAGRRRCLRA